MTDCQDSAGYSKSLAATRTAHGLVLAWRQLLRHDLQQPWSLAFPVAAGWLGWGERPQRIELKPGEVKLLRRP